MKRKLALLIMPMLIIMLLPMVAKAACTFDRHKIDWYEGSPNSGPILLTWDTATPATVKASADVFPKLVLADGNRISEGELFVMVGSIYRARWDAYVNLYAQDDTRIGRGHLEFYDSTPTGLVVSNPPSEIIKGENIQLSAVVTRGQYADPAYATTLFADEIAWSVVGGTDSSIDATGKLTVGENETAETLAIMADIQGYVSAPQVEIAVRDNEVPVPEPEPEPKPEPKPEPVPEKEQKTETKVEATGNSKKSTAAKTGDTSSAALYVLLSMLGTIGVVVTKKTK